MSSRKRQSCAEFRAACRPLVALAQADIGKEAGSFVVQAPTDADADFEVFVHQVMNARADKVLNGLIGPVVGEHAKVFDMRLKAFAERHLQDRRRGPDIEAVFLQAGRAVAKG